MGEQGIRRMGKTLVGKATKSILIDFLKFESGDPRGWILKAKKKKKIHYYQTPKELKMKNCCILFDIYKKVFIHE